MSKLILRGLLLLIGIAADIALPQIRSAVPNFIFLLVVIYAFRHDSEAYLGFAVIGGLLFDVYSSNAFGSYAVCLLLIGMAIRLSTATLFRSESRSVAYMAVAIVGSNFLLIGLLYAYNAFAQHWESTFQKLSPLYITHTAWLAIILNLVCALPVYFIVENIESLISKYNRPRNTFR